MELAFGDCRIDVALRELWRAGTSIRVEPQVLDLLLHLLRNRDRVVGKDELIAAVWGGRIVSDAAIISRINAARTAIGDNGRAQRLIRTVPRKGVRFVAPVRERRPPGNGERPFSVVVLPFSGLGGPRGQDWVAKTVTENLRTDLSTRVTGGFVASHPVASSDGTSSTHDKTGLGGGNAFVIEGSAGRIGSTLQVNARLIDAQSGAQIWADRFQTARSDAAAAQAEIAAYLARSLELELAKEAARRIGLRGDASPQEMVVLGQSVLHSRGHSEGSFREARQWFESALDADPDCIEAKLALADVLVSKIAIIAGIAGLRQQDYAQAEQLLREVLDSGRQRSLAHQVLGTLRRTQNRLAESRIELETALALDPLNVRAMSQLGLTLMFAGEPAAAIPVAQKALRISPREPGAFVGFRTLGSSYLVLNEPDRALEWLVRARDTCWTAPYIHRGLAAALALRGDTAAAQASLAESEAFGPAASSLAQSRRPPWGSERYLSLAEPTLFRGLRLAGMPEE